MTNKEFYDDKLLAVALENACGRLHRTIYGESCLDKKDCESCEFYTVEGIENWLNAEHKEPPLLKNGDGLNPGDWIMVRSKECEEWRKRRFMCFRRGIFITSDNSSIDLFGKGTHSDWKQARLPEEGE